MSRDRKIEIPLSKVVKSYFSHPSNLGVDPVIEKRHWLGKHFVNIMSYIPLSGSDLPLKEIHKSVDEYEIYSIEVTFPVKLNYITGHHLWALSACMESMFEISLMNFCRGRFAHTPSYHAAVEDFFQRYNLYDTDVDQDYFRRFIHKKYGSVINEELQRLEDDRLKQIEKQLKKAVEPS